MQNGRSRERLNRREALRTFANGFGMLGLAGLLAADKAASAPTPTIRWPSSRRCSPPRPSGSSSCSCPAGRRTSISSTPSRGLAQNDGKPLPFEKPKLVRTKTGNCLPRRSNSPSTAQCGIEVSELLPHSRRLRRRHLRHPLDGGRQHQPQRRLPADEHRRAGVLAAQPGLVAALRPGQREPESARLRRHQPAQPAQGAPLWSSSFLPAAYQGTLVADLKNPIANLKNPSRSA